MSLLLGQISAEANGSNAALFTFAIYTLAVFGLAYVASRLQKGRSFLSEYFLGSRNLGVWAFALTFAATSASGGSFTGFPSRIYSHGWVLALWIGSYMLVPALMMGLLGKRLNQMARQANAITIPDVLSSRFDSRPLGILSTLLIIFFLAFNLVAQFKAGAVILSTLLDESPVFAVAANVTGSVIQGWPLMPENPAYVLCLLFFSLAVVVYTSYGGFRAVVWTDVMQGVVMVVGVMVLLPMTLYHVGGLENATADLAKMVPPQKCYVQLEPVTQEDLTVGFGDWVSMPASDSSPRRVFRVGRPLQLPAGATSSPGERTVFALEILSPHEVARISTRDDVRVSHVFGEYTIEFADLSRNGVAVDDWVRLEDASDASTRLFRVVEPLQPPAEPSDTQPAAEQMRTRALECEPGDVASFIGSVRSDVTVASARSQQPYGFGKGQTGVYVSAPGPNEVSATGFLPVGVAISFFFFWTFSGAGQPSNMVRLMSFNSSLTLKRSITTVAFYFSLIYLPLVIIFCCGRVLMPGMEIESDRIMPALAERVTRMSGVPWLAGLLVAAPFAAVMSTVDSFLLMISSAIVRDVYQRELRPDATEKSMKRLTYAVTAVVGFAAFLGALNPPEYLQNIIVFTGGGLSASFLIPVGLALYWPRFNAAGAIAGMLGGFLTHVVMYVCGWLWIGSFEPIRIAGFDPFIPELIVSLVCAVLVCRLSPPPATRLIDRFFRAKAS